MTSDLQIRPRRLSILVVDDDPAVSRLVSDALGAEGHAVQTAGNGRIALDMLGERPYDVILSDMRMPELDGPGLYEALGERHPDLRSRIIFMTGGQVTPRIQAFLAETKVSVLQKPFDLEELSVLARRVPAVR